MGIWDWLRGRLATVTATPVGRAGDGLARLSAGGELDKPWGELQAELRDALEAWRRNPLARRIIALTTAYVVGDGITLTSEVPALDRFLQAFLSHEQNRIDLRLAGWCDELARSGELFLALHTNPVDGMSYVRTLPASRIDAVSWTPGDYERELSYHESVGPDDPDFASGGRTWLSPAHPEAEIGNDAGAVALRPWVLHFAVNRPAGCVRGESDLAPMLPWLRRYSRWLEDRVRLNAAVRAFLWIVKVPGGLVGAKQEQYRRPPEAGSVIVTENGREEWTAVAPNLHAADAAADGRAIRWMIASGGPGIGLTDLGEAETSNLATASAMMEQRQRFMRARQGYFAYVLASLAITAYNRAVGLGKVRGKPQELSAVRVGLPDINPADNSALGQASADVARALTLLQALGVRGDAFKSLALRLVTAFAGERLGEGEIGAIVRESDGF